MWEDTVPLKYRDIDYECTTCPEARAWAHGYRQNLTFDDAVWNILLKEMASAGMNMVIIDLGDAIQYESHPEISVKNAWSHKKLRYELAKMRKMGIEPIPKLNFATTHDIWLKDYSRMVSTDIYYGVCKDLIEEVSILFDKPRFFHLGMDEETAPYQKRHQYATVRQHDLWWGDLYFLIGEVEKNGMRSWIWSDYAWLHPEIFFKKMPKSVLQSNWYYGSEFDSSITAVKLYNDLERYGFDQIPTGSNHSNDVNMKKTADYCKGVIDKSRLLGFMTAPWRPTHAACLNLHKNAIKQMGKCIDKF
jgi:hypothetical protein